MCQVSLQNRKCALMQQRQGFPHFYRFSAKKSVSFLYKMGTQKAPIFHLADSQCAACIKNITCISITYKFVFNNL